MPDAHGLQDVPEDEYKCIDLALHNLCTSICGESLVDLQRLEFTQSLSRKARPRRGAIDFRTVYKVETQGSNYLSLRTSKLQFSFLCR
jgi:hypothetical protein